MVAGIGFTVSLFITSLAFVEGELADSAKVAVLFASVVAATVGSMIFVATARARPELAEPAGHTAAAIAATETSPPTTRSSRTEGHVATRTRTCPPFT